MKKFNLLYFLFLISINLKGQPNFVVIVLDDQGWTGSSVQMDQNIEGSQSDYYHTPELESLALAGLVFSQGYAPAPKCAPSRASILTGKTTARNSFTNTDNNIATDQILVEAISETTLNGNDITYAEWLKSTKLDYRTAHFGKWHLGRETNSSPSNNGFDFNDGATSNADGNHDGVVQVDPKYIFDLTSRSIDFIENAVADGVPFMLQLSHYAVHSDIEARQETIDKYNDNAVRPVGILHDNAEYGAMTEDTDEGVGLILKRITDLGIDDNTYIFFLSDNGGQINFSDNSPLSFGKTFITEGGIRVPFIVKGPNISGSNYSDEAIVAYDLFPTIAELTGSDEPLPSNIDGESIVPLLTGQTFTRSMPLFFHSPHYDENPNKTPRSAAVEGKYKLVVEYETGNSYLYDLSNDIGETTDISGSNLNLKKRLLISLRDHLKSVNANMPTLDPSHSNFSGSGVDIDEDGLEDAWEFRELLSYTFGPNDDPDNDGMTNLEEFNAGSDPYSETITNTECNQAAIFANETTNAVCFEEIDNVRMCTTNNIPEHEYGPFVGNNTLEGQDFSYSMCRYPELSENITELIEDPNDPSCGNGIIFGVSDQGINFSPFARLYWVNPNTNEENLNWHEEADFTLNMDLNGGHVNAASRYHYHNIPIDYYTDILNIDGEQHSPVLGYAADGFPIYYKYLYSENTNSGSSISAFESSYSLKSGMRPGDGTTAPNGEFDGHYIEDYEYIETLSELDECGGRSGITPEYPNGTYYYVLTDNWPFIPRCLKGKFVDNSFRLGQNCPTSTAFSDCSENPFENITSNNTYEDQFDVSVFPNPVVSCINLKTNNFQNEYLIRSIKIFDFNGSILYQTDIFEKDIDVSHLSQGAYFIQIESSQDQITKRFLVQ
ncbi:MAG: sulfatase-like hydrolase/transferase [Reichenbachiella sp.]